MLLTLYLAHNIRFILSLHVFAVDLVDIIPLHQTTLFGRRVFDDTADLHITGFPILDIGTDSIIDSLCLLLKGNQLFICIIDTVRVIQRAQQSLV